jgi:hypothetical protein
LPSGLAAFVRDQRAANSVGRDDDARH